MIAELTTTRRKKKAVWQQQQNRVPMRRESRILFCYNSYTRTPTSTQTLNLPINLRGNRSERNIIDKTILENDRFNHLIIARGDSCVRKRTRVQKKKKDRGWVIIIIAACIS